MKYARMQNGFCAIDVLNKAQHSTGEGKVIFLAGTLIHKSNLDPIIKERQFSQSLGDYLVVVLNNTENLFVGHVMHFGTTFLRITNNP